MVRNQNVLMFCAFAAVFFLCSIALAGDAGHIQVKCQPGMIVFLDGEMKGISSEQLGGLIIQDVPEGPHLLKVTKEGFQAQEHRVVVKAGQVSVVSFGTFAPMVQIKESGKSDSGTLAKKVGSLIVRSLPVECEIECEQLGLTGIRKSAQVWEASYIPVGKYHFVFNALDRRLETDLEVRWNLQTRVEVNFLKEKVDVSYPSPWDTYNRILAAIESRDEKIYMSCLTSDSREYLEKMWTGKFADFERQYKIKFFDELVAHASWFAEQAGAMFVDVKFFLREMKWLMLGWFVLDKPSKGAPREIVTEKDSIGHTVLLQVDETPLAVLLAEEGEWRVMLIPPRGFEDLQKAKEELDDIFANGELWRMMEVVLKTPRKHFWAIFVRGGVLGEKVVLRGPDKEYLEFWEFHREVERHARGRPVEMLGISLDTVTPDLRKDLGLPLDGGGVIITYTEGERVISDSSGWHLSYSSGLRVGQVIHSIDGRAVSDVSDYRDLTKGKKAGELLSVDLWERERARWVKTTKSVRVPDRP